MRREKVPMRYEESPHRRPKGRCPRAVQFEGKRFPSQRLYTLSPWRHTTDDPSPTRDARFCVQLAEASGCMSHHAGQAFVLGLTGKWGEWHEAENCHAV
jgi:hypothetical protein